MPEDNPKNQTKSEREAILKLIKTPLSFFVLIALIIEAVLGVVAVKSSGDVQNISLWGVIIVVLFLVIIVAGLTVWKPGSLIGNLSASQEISDFYKKVKGTWWEKVTPNDSTALSFFNIGFNEITSSVIMKGTTYNLNGDLVAKWWTVATCKSLDDNKMFYYWKGNHISDPGIQYEGFGELTFDDLQRKILKGRGLFSDTILTDLKATRLKTTILRRCSQEEIVIMSGIDNQAIKDCVLNILKMMS